MNKRTQLFGLYQTRRAIGRVNNTYLVERQFDVLYMHAAGVENTVAGSGTAITPEQAKLLSRFSPTITLVYDAYPAGLKASLKNCELLLRYGVSVNASNCPMVKTRTT